MTKKGSIRLSAGDSGLRQGQQPQYGGTNPSLYGRDSEYAAKTILASGERAARNILSSGDILNREITRATAAVERSAGEREHNLDLVATTRLKNYLETVSSQLDMSEGQRFGGDAAGSEDRVKAAFAEIIQRLESGVLTFDIGGEHIEFGSQTAFDRAVAEVQGTVARQTAHFVTRETGELRSAAMESVETIAAQRIAEVQRNPGGVDEFAEKLRSDISELLNNRFVSEDTIAQIIAKKETALYTAAADRNVTDLLSQAQAAARTNGDWRGLLDQARSVAGDDGEFGGRADAGSLADMRLRIENTATTLQSRADAENDRALSRAAATTEAAIRAQGIKIEQAMNNIVESGGSFGRDENGLNIEAGGATIQRIQRVCDDMQALYDRMYAYDVARVGEDYANSNREYRERQLAEKHALMMRATQEADFRQEWRTGGGSFATFGTLR